MTAQILHHVVLTDCRFCIL